VPDAALGEPRLLPYLANERPRHSHPHVGMLTIAPPEATSFGVVVRGGQRVRKDTKTHQDRWLAIDPDTCALIASYLDGIRDELAAVGVELSDDAHPPTTRLTSGRGTRTLGHLPSAEP
jgi:hypothetical protein